jgi:hypothetical protein
MISICNLSIPHRQGALRCQVCREVGLNRIFEDYDTVPVICNDRERVVSMLKSCKGVL